MSKLIDHYAGWKPQKPDHRDFQLVHSLAQKSLPLTCSLRSSKFMPHVYDQGQLGSCTANAIGSAYEFELGKQGEDFMPSRLWIYYQERYLEGTVGQDSGAELRDGMKVVSKLGVPPESDWPYDPATFVGPPPAKASKFAGHSKAINYMAIQPGSGRLRACIAQGYPFVFGFSVIEALESPEMASGKQLLLPMPKRGEGFIGGHAVKAIGYDWSCKRFPIPVFEIKNSWGPDWCEAGYFYMDAKYFDQLAQDIWTIRLVDYRF